MGRRSINTTKSGKFMNPTDQARKEARKRELKKNKKQRTMVRMAVLKNKDPTVIMSEMRSLDLMEFDPLNPPPYNLKVLHEKRKKLTEMWDRVLRLYGKEDPTKVNEMKAIEKEYEMWKKELCTFYESVQQTRRVKVDDIPLPNQSATTSVLSYLVSPSEIPLPVNSDFLDDASQPSVTTSANQQSRPDISTTNVFESNRQLPVNTTGIEAAMKAAAAVLASKPDFFNQRTSQASGDLNKSPHDPNVSKREDYLMCELSDAKKVNCTKDRKSRFDELRRPPGPPPGAPLAMSEYENSDSDDDDDNEQSKVNRRIRAYRSELNAERMVKQDNAINRKKVRFHETYSDSHPIHAATRGSSPSSKIFCHPSSQQVATNESDPHKPGVSIVTSSGLTQNPCDTGVQMKHNYLDLGETYIPGGRSTMLHPVFNPHHDLRMSIPPHFVRTNDGHMHFMPSLQNHSTSYPPMGSAQFLRDGSAMINPPRDIAATRFTYQAAHPSSHLHPLYPQNVRSQMTAFIDPNNPHAMNRFYAGAEVEQVDKAGHKGVIEAKPQLKNRIASITKLVPTVLKVKRTANKAGTCEHRFGESDQIARMYATTKSTDVAYDIFMKEMENVLK